VRSDMRSVFMTLPAAVHGAFPRILWAGRIRGERTLAMRARAITDRAWDWFGEEECGLVVLIFCNTFLFGAARGAWSLLPLIVQNSFAAKVDRVRAAARRWWL